VAGTWPATAVAGSRARGGEHDPRKVGREAAELVDDGQERGSIADGRVDLGAIADDPRVRNVLV